MVRGNLSGVYLIDKLDGDISPQPTCFEDCNLDTQKEWLDSLDNEALKRLALLLGNALKEISTTYNIYHHE